MKESTHNDAAMAVARIEEKNGTGTETITKRVAVKAKTLAKMHKLVSLFDDEINIDVKEPELIGFFLEKGFAAIVASGEIDKRVKLVLGQ